MPLWHQKWSGFTGSQSREKLGKSKPTADSPLGSRQTLTALCPLLNSSPALQVCGAEDSGHQGELEDDLVLEEEAKILTVGGGGWGVGGQSRSNQVTCFGLVPEWWRGAPKG